MRKICKIISLLVVFTFIVTACSFSSEKSVSVSINGKNVVDAKVDVDTSAPKLINVDVNTTSFPRIQFGSYNGDAITWYIISEDDKSRILLSEKILGSLQYNSDSQPVEWQETTLHNYLNSRFVDECFTSEERSKMMTTNDEDDDIVTMPTLDNLVTLYGDIYYVEKNYYANDKYFEANEKIVAKPINDMLANNMDTFNNSLYSRLNEVDIDDRYSFAEGCGSYWVLDQDYDNAVAFYVTATGYIGNVGYDETDVGYRPIIRIKKI